LEEVLQPAFLQDETVLIGAVLSAEEVAVASETEGGQVAIVG
jgi:hypothetical protein